MKHESDKLLTVSAWIYFFCYYSVCIGNIYVLHFDNEDNKKRRFNKFLSYSLLLLEPILLYHYTPTMNTTNDKRQSLKFRGLKVALQWGEQKVLPHQELCTIMWMAHHRCIQKLGTKIISDMVQDNLHGQRVSHQPETKLILLMICVLYTDTSTL